MAKREGLSTLLSLIVFMLSKSTVAEVVSFCRKDTQPCICPGLALILWDNLSQKLIEKDNAFLHFIACCLEVMNLQQKYSLLDMAAHWAANEH